MVHSRFSSFPDSNSSFIGDTVFTFRTEASEATKHAMQLPMDTAAHLYGYVFFRQKRDPSIRRGFLQKSLVILSTRAYPGLFLRVVGILGPLYFEALHPSPAVTPGGSRLSLVGEGNEVTATSTVPRIGTGALSSIARPPVTMPRSSFVAPIEEPLASSADEFLNNIARGSASAGKSHVQSVLEAFAYQMAVWPAPDDSGLMELPLLNSLLMVELPPATDSHGQFIETSRFYKRRGVPSAPAAAAKTGGTTLADATSRHRFSRDTIDYKEQILASIPSSLSSPRGFLNPLPYVTLPYIPMDLPVCRSSCSTVRP